MPGAMQQLDEDLLPLHISTRQELDAFVAGSELAVVMVTATASCFICRQFEPKFAQYAASQAPRVRFATVDADEADEAALEGSDIATLPTLLLFRGGKEVHRIAGRQVVRVMAPQALPGNHRVPSILQCFLWVLSLTRSACCPAATAAALPPRLGLQRNATQASHRRAPSGSSRSRCGGTCSRRRTRQRTKNDMCASLLA